ncbi:hypothetical protein CY658_05020 [Variovorax sp. RO1]|uniref:hypothetical protein n=1 Tax=Variovorax sp. RO1 TaxID=2066034 RepID=UPI000C716F2A|nr:hypothetical protein [Variovorax sp. RO1]PLC06399.1 hypothetical protein CY658_05020 [Variovorax sp. RO1]
MSGVIMKNPNAFGAALCEVLGLKQVTKLVLTMEVGCMMQVEATVVAPSQEDLAPVLKRFRIEAVPVLESPDAAPQARSSD